MYRSLFRNRNFMALWVGQIVSFIGDYFVMLAVPFVVNRLTGSSMMIGLTYMAGAIPALLLGPVAGVFIDRWDRRKVMIFSDLARAALVLLFLLVQTKEQVWIFYVVNFTIACASQFFVPARSALLPRLVATDDLLAANGLMQIIQTVGFLAGPALAGFAIALWGESTAFMVNAVGYVCSAAAVMLIRLPVQERSAAAARALRDSVRAVVGELRDGLAYMLGNSSVVGVVVMLTVAQLGFGAFMVVWIPFLQRYFNQGPQGVGLIDSFFGAGMLLGGVLLGALARRVRKVPMAAGGMLILGLISVPFGYSPTFWLILLLNFLFGVVFTPFNSALATIMQLAVPDSKRGRVSSSLNAMVTVGGLLSMAFASFFGEAIGLRNLFVVMGLVIMLSGVLGFVLLREPQGQVKEDAPAIPELPAA